MTLYPDLAYIYVDNEHVNVTLSTPDTKNRDRITFFDCTGCAIYFALEIIEPGDILHFEIDLKELE